MVSKFAEIEAMFSSLLEASRSVLSEDELAEIQDYVDVGEYGLALRATVAIYAEENKRPSDDARNLIGLLAKAMAMDPHSLLDRLST